MNRPSVRELRVAWNLRWKRRRILWRCFRSRRALTAVRDRTGAIAPDAILSFSTVRNEMARLPGFLDHHRKLGVRHFLFVDNGSDDGTVAFLAAQPDVSLWQTNASYRAARFGLDWIGWLMMRHAHGHWALVLDADETLIYPYWETRDLRALTAWLDAQGREMFPAMMLDLYPEGRLSEGRKLEWFDSGNYTIRLQPKMRNLWIQGGVRSRMLLEDPRRGPTLTKVPLVKWNRRFAYVNSAHSILPRRLNQFYDGGPSGILLHDKFADGAPERAAKEKSRREHFFDPVLFDDYYDALIADPVLHGPHSRRLTGWRQLEALGLMSRGGWI